MPLKKLHIKGFRNLKPLKLNFEPGDYAHAFIGSNAQGKTNVLEAIYLLSLSKSFRTKATSDLVGFDQDFSSIEGEVDTRKLEIVITAKPNQKVLKINGVKKKASEFVGQLKAVFFSPDDLASMSYSPMHRRRYLDIMLSQLNRDYLEALMRYKEACQQRNALLKRIRDGEATTSELAFWDEVLAKKGALITGQRSELLQDLTPLINTYYQAISDSQALIKINYISEVRGVGEEEFQNMLKKTRQRDILVGETKLGPHRDDVAFLLDARDMSQFASRGEWRSLVLALKFAEIDLLKEKTGTRPVLLLDDVFSELDEKRQKYLFKAIKNYQTFITTTHQTFVEDYVGAVRIFKVKEGEVLS